MNKGRLLSRTITLLLGLLILAGCKVSDQPTGEPTASLTDVAVIATVQSPKPSESPTLTASPSPSVSPVPTATSGGIKGLVLVVPVLVKNVETVSEDVRGDDTYREELLYDSIVSVVDERLKSIEFNEKSVTEQVAKLNGIDASDVLVKKDDAISARLSYPAWRITYMTGANEDTRKNVDIYIQTDNWDFRFHTATPSDSFNDYSENIESWIESIDLSDGK